MKCRLKRRLKPSAWTPSTWPIISFQACSPVWSVHRRSPCSSLRNFLQAGSKSLTVYRSMRMDAPLKYLVNVKYRSRAARTVVASPSYPPHPPPPLTTMYLRLVTSGTRSDKSQVRTSSVFSSSRLIMCCPAPSFFPSPRPYSVHDHRHRGAAFILFAAY